MPITPLRWLALVAAMALAVGLSFLLMRLTGRSISLLWPASGVAVGSFAVCGKRAIAPVFLGYLSVWIFIHPGVTSWGVLALPFLYPCEAWCIARYSYRLKETPSGPNGGMARAVWSYLGAPIIFVLPTAAISAILFSISGRYAFPNLANTIFLLAVTHLHGVIAMAALTIHVLNGDFRVRRLGRLPRGVPAGIAAVCIMALAFSGAFDRFLTPAGSIFLPFPFLMMAAVSLAPPPASLLVAVWCVASSVLTSCGLGPFSAIPGGHGLSPNPAELGLYNMTMASVVYLISVGSSRLLRQLSLTEMALAAAGIELWEWDPRNGPVPVQSGSDNRYITDTAAGRPAPEALSNLAGGAPGKIRDSWRVRLNGSPPLESVGRVLERGPDGRPLAAIGLLQDLSALQRAEEALIALGYQKAALRNLQSKLNPHFLFNSLNVIRALVHIDPAGANEAVTSLAGLLRGTLASVETALVPLGDELGQIDALLHLARLRFGNRLVSSTDIPAGLLDAPVPPMMILNLVENAITHGIGALEDGGEIHVSARAEGGMLRISVRNSGVLPATSNRGIGTCDVLQRLEILYSGRAGFTLSQSGPATVLAEITIPFSSPQKS